MMNEGEIKICTSHSDYPVPLIFTMVHPYNEYWCPYCGKKEGMMGAGTPVLETPELKQRKELFERLYKPYLNGTGFMNCAGFTYMGETIKPQEAPVEVQSLYEKMSHAWEHGIKVEEWYYTELTKCKECKGEGTIPLEEDGDEDNCKACDGTGKILDKVSV